MTNYWKPHIGFCSFTIAYIKTSKLLSMIYYIKKFLKTISKIPVISHPQRSKHLSMPRKFSHIKMHKLVEVRAEYQHLDHIWHIPIVPISANTLSQLPRQKKASLQTEVQDVYVLHHNKSFCEKPDKGSNLQDPFWEGYPLI